MKEEIYTIPVTDGFKSDTECPFCAMRRTLEENTINYVLSPAYMEEDVRGETNAKGFCPPHLQRLYNQNNALGLALILHSHLKEQHKTIESLLQTADAPKKRFGKKAENGSPLEQHRQHHVKSCYVCERVDTVFERYMAAFFMLWKRSAEFRSLVTGCKGFCLNHFMQVYEQAGQHLGTEAAKELRQTIVPLQMENLKRVEDDLEWYTLKFDYRYKDQPWKNAKDALPRSIVKIGSVFVEKEKK